MKASKEKSPTQKQFLLNMDKKIEGPDFGGDIYALLRPSVEYNQTNTYELINKFIS